jgi:hypothetical protein
MTDTDHETTAVRVERFRTAHSEPAGIIVLELAQNQGAGYQFSMTLSMAQQIVKSLQDQISKTKGKLS